jgi:hypothetical protein
MRIPEKGDRYFDKLGDVIIMAFVDGWVMMRRKGKMMRRKGNEPFVKIFKDFEREFIFRCNKNGTADEGEKG